MNATVKTAPAKLDKPAAYEQVNGLLLLALHERAGLLHRISEQPQQLISGAIPRLTVLAAAGLLTRLESLCQDIEGVSNELWTLAGRSEGEAS